MFKLIVTKFVSSGKRTYEYRPAKFISQIVIKTFCENTNTWHEFIQSVVVNANIHESFLVKLIFQIMKWFILINSEVQIICKRLFNVFVELETDSEDQQKPPQPENVGDIACLFINRPHTNTTQINKRSTQN